MISWKNPDEAAGDLGLNDYLERGLFDALDQVDRVTAGAPIHTAGYCLGGALLAIGAAALRCRDPWASVGLKSMTLFAAQTDYCEPGELGLFIDASEFAYLDALMAEQGYLDGLQMALAFQLLHTRDLACSRLLQVYVLGQQTKAIDLMAWNADTTRLPAQMHSETLRSAFEASTVLGAAAGACAGSVNATSVTLVRQASKLQLEASTTTFDVRR